MGRPWASEFTYAELERLFEAVLAHFVIYPLSHASSQFDGNAAFIRHDIDLDLETALPVAQRESRMGIRASYLVMTSSPTYTLTSRESALLIEKIIDLGHEIGLHSNPPPEAIGDLGDLEEFVYRDAELVEEVVGDHIQVVSFHKPVASLLRGPLLMGGRVNAYAAELMELYLSDSRARWRVEDPIAVVREADVTRFQLLIHPIWWSESSASGPDRLQRLFERLTRSMDASDVIQLDEALAEHLTIRRRGG